VWQYLQKCGARFKQCSHCSMSLYQQLLQYNHQ
jgi:hypothetical protein